MYTGLTHFHSFFGAFVLVTILAATVFSVMSKGQVPTAKFKKIALVSLIFTHIQLLVGIIQYFISPYFEMFLADPGAAMKDATTRLLVVEHPLMNIVAVILITMAYSSVKKAFNNQKAITVKTAVLYALGLVLLLSRIPWDRWLG